MSQIEDIVSSIFTKYDNKNDIELVDTEFVKEGPDWFLRLYIDKPGGVNLDDCESVSRFVEKELDIINPINQSYILEVSSLGLERQLKKEKDFIRNKGKKIYIKLYKPINGQKELIGILKDYKKPIVYLDIDGTLMEIDEKQAAVIHLYFDFDGGI